MHLVAGLIALAFAARWPESGYRRIPRRVAVSLAATYWHFMTIVWLGLFLLGAYQEVLGDLHNLFGDTDAVNVIVASDGRYRLADSERGDSVNELLGYVHFNPEEMLESYLRKLREQGISAPYVDSFYRELKAGLQGYTYLKT